METLTIAVADKDSDIIVSIRESIAIHSNFEIIGEAKTGEDLLELIYLKQPNVVIVDYDLPSIHSTLFNSEYKEYLPAFQLILIGRDKNLAIEAFNYSAIGYVPRPIDFSRLIACLYKAKDFLSMNLQNATDNRILIKLNNGFVYLRMEEILFIEIIARKTIIHTVKNKYETTESLQSFVDRLPWYFYRTHRSFLTNLKKVDRIELFGESYLGYFKGTNKSTSISKLKIRTVHALLIR